MVKVSVLVSLFRCQQFIEPFLNYCTKIDGLDQIEFLFLHNDPLPDEIAVIKQYLLLLPHATHEEIKEREGLYATWNRGIKLAKGAYITVWNVDDIRFPKSILEQAKVLDDNPDAGLAYGDMYCSYLYGVSGQKVTHSPLWAIDYKEFCRKYHMSCFQMWRKSIHDTLGYYDEQFKCSADFDFQIRVAMHYPLVKAPNLLGIYLEMQPHKLSSNGLQQYENNIIHLRYGAYEHLDLPTLAKSVKIYNKGKQLFFGVWVDWAERSPFDKGYKTKGLVRAVGNFPLSFAKMTVKKMLTAIKRK